MSEPCAQRTLVKSPPELWAEVSDVATLARHLGDLGEIRITRLEPETTVAWEGDRARGTVELEASGWGTKVTITAAAALVAAEPDPDATVEMPAVAAVAVAPRRGLLARLRRRREAPVVVPEPAPRAAPEPEPAVDDGALEALLVAVLDELGAAHHRPFSRG